MLQVRVPLLPIRRPLLSITAASIAACPAAAQRQLPNGACQISSSSLVLPLLQLLPQPLYAVKQTHLSCRHAGRQAGRQQDKRGTNTGVTDAYRPQ